MRIFEHWTMDRRETLESARRSIEEAFAGVPYPGQGSLSYNPHSPDGEDLERAFAGKRRDQISPALMMLHGLLFFSPEAFRYFLPAYLAAALDPGNLDIRKDTVFSLAPLRQNVESVTDFKARVSHLTASERHAVRDFLLTIKELYSQDFAAEIPALDPAGFWF
jgi:hypothetical protein